MQELNEQRLRSLLKILEEEDVDSPRKPALIKYPSSLLFTDGGLILEWPDKLVDDKDKLFRQMLDAGKDQPDLVRLREAQNWLNFVTAGEKVKFHPVEEAEPDDQLDHLGCMDYICRTRRCHYRIGYIVAAEEMIGANKPSYKCIIPHYSEDLVILCVFEGGSLVGAIANEADHGT